MEWLLAAMVAFAWFVVTQGARLKLWAVLVWWVIWVLLVGLLHSAW